MQHIFTYGSLMFDPVWSRVVTHTYTSSRARLPGYQRCCVINETYPIAIPACDAYIDGILYWNVNAQDVTRLDTFEGDYYHRIPVNIELASGAVAAWVYALNPVYQHVVDYRPWDVEQFSQTGMTQFLQRYQGFLT